MIAYNEQELIYLYHLGSIRAYEILLSEYRKFIYAYANRYDSVLNIQKIRFKK